MPVDRKVQGKCSVIKLLAGGSDKQRCNSSDHQGLSASTPPRNKRQIKKAAASLVFSFFEASGGCILKKLQRSRRETVLFVCDSFFAENFVY